MARKVLVVDDDLMVAGFMFDVLEGLGYDAREVYSGQEALDVLRADGGFDLVITDLNMPRMDGYALTGHIKAAWPDLQVAVVTANYWPEMANDTATRVLAKPYSREELRRLMKQLDASRMVEAH